MALALGSWQQVDGVLERGKHPDLLPPSWIFLPQQPEPALVPQLTHVRTTPLGIKPEPDTSGLGCLEAKQEQAESVPGWEMPLPRAVGGPAPRGLGRASLRNLGCNPAPPQKWSHHCGDSWSNAGNGSQPAGPLCARWVSGNPAPPNCVMCYYVGQRPPLPGLVHL